MKLVYAILVLVAAACVGCNGQSGEPNEATVGDALAALGATTPTASEEAASLAGPVHKVRPASGFVPANPDTRTPLQWAQAACQAASYAPDDPQRGWRCGSHVPRPTVLAASSGQTPIIPTSWTVPNWYVNKLTGSDANSCTSSGSPCASKNEIVAHRLGCGGMPDGCPRFQQTTVLEQDASDTDNTDPLYLHFACEKGGNCFSVQGAAPTIVTSTTLGAATAARNKAAGTNALLLAQFTAGAPSTGQMVQNTTHASRAFVYSANGGNWNMTNPAALQAIPSSTYTEVNTWANTDAVRLLSLVSVNVVDLKAVVADYNAGFNNMGYVYQLTIFDPSGATNDTVRLQNITVSECVFQRSLVITGSGDFTVSVRLFNDFNGGGLLAAGGNVQVLGGAINSAAGANGQFIEAAESIFDGDYVNGFQLTNDASLIYVANVYLDAMIQSPGNIEIINDPTSEGLANPVLWGSGANTINMAFNAHLAQRSSTFVNVFTAPGLVTGVKLNGANTGSSSTTAGVLSPAITLTPAHLDAAQGAAGCGGTCFNQGGASVSSAF